MPLSHFVAIFLLEEVAFLLYTLSVLGSSQFCFEFKKKICDQVQKLVRPWPGLQLQRSRVLCESTFGQVDPGRRTKLYTWQKVFPGRRVTLPSQASDPASRLVLLVDRLYNQPLF